jgi:hypothetical protein
MRRLNCLLLISSVLSVAGCTWSDFWSSVAYSVNGSAYRRQYDDYEFQQNYDQQAKAAQEYYQSHK